MSPSGMGTSATASSSTTRRESPSSARKASETSSAISWSRVRSESSRSVTLLGSSVSWLARCSSPRGVPPSRWVARSSSSSLKPSRSSAPTIERISATAWWPARPASIRSSRTWVRSSGGSPRERCDVQSRCWGYGVRQTDSKNVTRSASSTSPVLGSCRSSRLSRTTTHRRSFNASHSEGSARVWSASHSPRSAVAVVPGSTPSDALEDTGQRQRAGPGAWRQVDDRVQVLQRAARRRVLLELGEHLGDGGALADPAAPGDVEDPLRAAVGDQVGPQLGAQLVAVLPASTPVEIRSPSTRRPSSSGAPGAGAGVACPRRVRGDRLELDGNAQLLGQPGVVDQRAEPHTFEAVVPVGRHGRDDPDDVRAAEHHGAGQSGPPGVAAGVGLGRPGRHGQGQAAVGGSGRRLEGAADALFGPAALPETGDRVAGRGPGQGARSRRRGPTAPGRSRSRGPVRRSAPRPRRGAARRRSPPVHGPSGGSQGQGLISQVWPTQAGFPSTTSTCRAVSTRPGATR